jgi:SpoVK/Ycf46/Vps4 family AAA+-type ATPase
LIGQMLRLHVLCTLNQGMEHLDPAMLRPGRLRGYRYVGPLSAENAEKLAAKHKLPFVADKTRDHYTLAEVFHGKVYEQNEPKAIGFSRLAN